MTKIKTGSIQAGENEIRFLECGEGKPFLFAHGFPDHPGSFEHQMVYFGSRGYRVIAPYMRGYGPKLSEENPTFGAYDTGSDLLKLMDALEISKAILLGHDWGASAAYAASFLAPERIEALITASVPYGTPFMQSLIADGDQQRRSWYMFFFLAPFAEAAVSANNFAFVERLWKEWSPGLTVPTAHMKTLKDIFSDPGNLTAALSYYRDTFSGKVRAGRNDPAFKDFGRAGIKVPTLYLHGKQDGCISPSLATDMEDYFENGLVTEIIDQAGHFLQLEQPDLVNRTIEDFLNK
ncbi:MAG: alpha/beta hydrolase [Sneathiellales bacterium]|nr:alpha/beta hydrolase [Sneathiellales bacterium]